MLQLSIFTVLGCVLCLFVFIVSFFFFLSSRRRHTRCALVTGVQTCALPISGIQKTARHPIAWRSSSNWRETLTLATKPVILRKSVRCSGSSPRTGQIGRESCRERVCQYV